MIEPDPAYGLVTSRLERFADSFDRFSALLAADIAASKEARDTIILLLQREPQPTVTLWFPIGGSKLLLQCRYLVLSLIIAGTVNVEGTITLSVGDTKNTQRHFPFGASDTKVFPFTEILQRGQNISIASAEGVAEGYIIADVLP